MVYKKNITLLIQMPDFEFGQEIKPVYDIYVPDSNKDILKEIFKETGEFVEHEKQKSDTKADNNREKFAWAKNIGKALVKKIQITHGSKVVNCSCCQCRISYYNNECNCCRCLNIVMVGYHI